MRFERLALASKVALTVAWTAALLAACGGGNDSAPPSVSVPSGTRSVAASAGADVSSSNAASLGGSAASAVLSATAGGLLDVTGSGRESPQGVVAVSTALDAPTLPGRLVRAALRQGAAAQTAAREQPQANSSQTLPCPTASGSLSGSLTISLADADNNGKLSNGDGLTLTLHDCVLDSGLPEASGSFTLAINIVELNSAEDPVAIDVTASFNSFAIDGLGTFSGSFQLWSRPEGSGERFRISYRSTAVQQGPLLVYYNFDVYGVGDDNGGSFDINGGIAIGGQTFSIIGSNAFVFIGANPPHAGSLRLVDAAGDALRLTARSSSLLDLDFFPFGALTPLLSLPGLLWSAFGG